MKFVSYTKLSPNHSSPPSRGAWIEMGAEDVVCDLRGVAPLAGGVD